MVVLLFYWIPLFSASATIQGDTADVHYPLQKYFAERLFSGHLPFWTPYLSSGYPLLTSPLTGAWYPLNWPFFLIGVTPIALRVQLALHAVLACMGTYFLLLRMVKWRGAAIIGGFAFGFSGFFAAHSAHLSVFESAAWFPWLLLTYRHAAEKPGFRFPALGGIVGALTILSGSLQIAGFGFIGLILFALADIISGKIRWSRGASVVTGIILGAVVVSAIQLLPALEVSRYLGGATTATQTQADDVLRAGPLMTLVAPDWLGTISKKHQEPGTGAYFYGGILLLPIALLGFGVSRWRWSALLLIIPTVWFMLGPSAGLYRLGGMLPSLQSGPPVYAWFLVAFALAAMAAAGCDWIFSLGHRAVVVVMIGAVLLVGDLWYWNSFANPLAYGRQSYWIRYGQPEMLGRRLLAPQLPLTRFGSPYALRGIGPLLQQLDMKFETTYTYLLPESVYYREYQDAMVRNPRLRDGLNVSRSLNFEEHQIDVNASVLPRVYFPRSIRAVLDEAESRQALYSLDPTASSTVLPPHETIQQDPSADAFVRSFGEQFYRVHYVAGSPSLLKLSVAWYPGWRARTGARSLPILRVDHALMGVVVPPGESDIDFTFSPASFYGGATISVLASLALLLIALGGRFYGKLDRYLFPNRLKRHRLADQSSI